MSPRSYRHRPMLPTVSTHTLEFEEIPATWQGRPILIDADYTARGRMTRGYPQTLMSPEEPPEFDILGDSIEITHITGAGDDAETAYPLTDAALVAAASAAIRAYVEAHERDILARIEQEASDNLADAEAAAVDRAVDAAIDARRERGCH